MKYSKKIINGNVERYHFKLEFNESIRNAIDEVEYYQASCVSDSSTFYQALESFKIQLYKEYIKEYERGFKNE